MAKDTGKTPTPEDEQRAKFEAALEAKKHKQMDNPVRMEPIIGKIESPLMLIS